MNPTEKPFLIPFSLLFHLYCPKRSTGICDIKLESVKLGGVTTLGAAWGQEKLPEEVAVKVT